MALSDWEQINDPTAPSKKGGQGTIIKVVHRESGEVGALKQMHPQAMESKERRHRFRVEVDALRILDGDGAPKLLDPKAVQWSDSDTELYVVMEWVEGPTLQQKVTACKTTIDDALTASLRLAEILERCHNIPLYHRDIKPDNIIMRNGNWSEPVLVDFGMSWGEPINEAACFKTPQGQELGNRFLRLPEYRPGGHHYDPRSDVSMAVALLFFTLCGHAPRALTDERGRLPHELLADAFPSFVTTDPRWHRLRRIFTIGFQHRLEFRYQCVTDFKEEVRQVKEDVVEGPVDQLDKEIESLKELFESERARCIDEVRPLMECATDVFVKRFKEIVQEAGLEIGGQNPISYAGGAVRYFHYNVHQRGIQTPFVHFQHRLTLSDGKIEASFRLDQYGDQTKGWEVYYTVPAADGERLMELQDRNVRGVAAKVIRTFLSKYKSPEPSL